MLTTQINEQESNARIQAKERSMDYFILVQFFGLTTSVPYMKQIPNKSKRDQQQKRKTICALFLSA